MDNSVNDKVYYRRPILELFMTCCLFVCVAASVYLLYNESILAMKIYLSSFILISIVAPTYYRLIGQLLKYLSSHFLNKYPFNDPMCNPLTLEKVSQKSWQLLIHIVTSVWVYYVMTLNGWLTNPKSMFDPDPHGKATSSAVTAIYAFQLGIWTYSSIRHRFFEARRRDFYVMFTHHLTTILLEILSFQDGETSFGLFVILIHESSDIIVETVKIMNHIHAYHKEGYYLSESFFILNLITWFISRLYLYPTRIYKQVLPYARHRYSDYSLFNFKSFYYLPTLSVIIYLCWILLILHIFWFVLFLNMLVTMLTKSSEDTGKIYEGDDNASLNDNKQKNE